MKIGCWYINDSGCCEFDDSYVGPIDIPKVATACTGMFAFKQIKAGCYLRDFDTRTIDNFENMFRGCTIPEGFTFGDKFDTNLATSFKWMFAGANLPTGFKLSEKFVIPKGADCFEMFAECTFAPGVVLSDKITKADARNTDTMLSGATWQDGTPYELKLDMRITEEDKLNALKRVAATFGDTRYLSASEQTEPWIANMFSAALYSMHTAADDGSAIESSMLQYKPYGMSDVDALHRFIGGLDLVRKYALRLKEYSNSFDANDYLMRLCGPHYSSIPQASINQCRTKEDCDELYARLIKM